MGRAYGDAPKQRVWQLIEALLDYKDDRLDDSRCPANIKVRWKDDKLHQLLVDTTLEDLAILIYGKDDWRKKPKSAKETATKDLSDRLTHYLKKFLNLLERHGGGRGDKDWIITLTLWSRSKDENKREFDRKWRETPPPNSSGNRRLPSPIEETNSEDAEQKLVATPSTRATDKKVALHEAIPAVPVWKGRDELLNDLKAKLLQPENPPKVLALIGQGGIGKTSLAVKLLEAIGVNLSSRTVTTDCPYQCAMYFKAKEETSFDEVANFLLIDGLNIQTAEPLKTAEEKIAKIIAGLTQTRCLLVLDNLESILQKTDDPQPGRAVSLDWGKLINALVYQQHQAQTILTSREVPSDLGDSRSKKIRINSKLVEKRLLIGVDIEAGIEILQAYNSQDKYEDLKWISERVKGHVLVLTLLASEYAEQPGYLRKRPELVTDEVQPILREQLIRQSEAARDLLRRMCVLRVAIDVRGLTFLRLYENDWKKNYRFEMAAALEEPAELTEEEISETKAILERLVDSSLVQCRYDREKCESFYDLHRVIVECLQADYKEELPNLWKSIYKFYCTGKSVENPKTLEDLRPVLEAQYFAFQLGNYIEASSLVMGTLEKYLRRWGYWNLLQDLYEKILDYVRDEEHSYCLISLGAIHRDKGNWGLAEEYLNYALSIAQEQDIKSLFFTALAMLGEVEQNRGNWEEAERLYRQSFEGMRELGDRLWMASIWGVLGDIERNRGNWEKAEQLYQQSLKLRTELGDRSGMATNWGQLGDIERNRGNWEEAKRLHRQSLEVETELGDRSGMARSIGSLGEVELSRDNLDIAEQLLTDALERFKELGETWFIAEASFRIAQVWQKRGNTELAQQHYNTAHQIFQQLGAAKELERIEREWESD